MEVSDFEFISRDKSKYVSAYWRYKDKVRTPLSEFTIELFTSHLAGGKNDRRPPNQEMLRRAADLIHFAETQGEYIVDVVFRAYRLFLEDQGLKHLDIEGVPKTVSRDNIGQLIEEPSLHVDHYMPSVLTRLFRDKETYRSLIVTPPVWDPEHGFTMEFENGRVISVLDAPFTLEAGVLRFS